MGVHICESAGKESEIFLEFNISKGWTGKSNGQEIGICVRCINLFPPNLLEEEENPYGGGTISVCKNCSGDKK